MPGEEAQEGQPRKLVLPKIELSDAAADLFEQQIGNLATSIEVQADLIVVLQGLDKRLEILTEQLKILQDRLDRLNDAVEENTDAIPSE